MPHTNVELSKNELELVTSSEFILTKNRIIEKVYNLFGLLSETYKNVLHLHKENLPHEIITSSPKIYKGENYLTLPYVLMDHPRVFSKDDVFAIRSFFWWGNYFSITLHLSGKYLQLFKNSIQQKLNNAIIYDYFICVNDEQWQHHFEETNYKLLKEIDSAQEHLNKPFFKIAKQLSLQKWNDAEDFYLKNYTSLLEIIAAG
ncbi:MAG: hypothetical protein ABJA35_15025 [Parafilimonas sp.]